MPQLAISAASEVYTVDLPIAVATTVYAVKNKLCALHGTDPHLIEMCDSTGTILMDWDPICDAHYANGVSFTQQEGRRTVVTDDVDVCVHIGPSDQGLPLGECVLLMGSTILYATCVHDNDDHTLITDSGVRAVWYADGRVWFPTSSTAKRRPRKLIEFQIDAPTGDLRIATCIPPSHMCMPSGGHVRMPSGSTYTCTYPVRLLTGECRVSPPSAISSSDLAITTKAHGWATLPQDEWTFTVTYRRRNCPLRSYGPLGHIDDVNALMRILSALSAANWSSASTQDAMSTIANDINDEVLNKLAKDWVADTNSDDVCMLCRLSVVSKTIHALCTLNSDATVTAKEVSHAATCIDIAEKLVSHVDLSNQLREYTRGFRREVHIWARAIIDRVHIAMHPSGASGNIRIIEDLTSQLRMVFRCLPLVIQNALADAEAHVYTSLFERNVRPKIDMLCT